MVFVHVRGVSRVCVCNSRREGNEGCLGNDFDFAAGLRDCRGRYRRRHWGAEGVGCGGKSHGGGARDDNDGYIWACNGHIRARNGHTGERWSAWCWRRRRGTNCTDWGRPNHRVVAVEATRRVPNIPDETRSVDVHIPGNADRLRDEGTCGTRDNDLHAPSVELWLPGAVGASVVERQELGAHQVVTRCDTGGDSAGLRGVCETQPVGAEDAVGEAFVADLEPAVSGANRCLRVGNFLHVHGTGAFVGVVSDADTDRAVLERDVGGGGIAVNTPFESYLVAVCVCVC